MTVSQESRLLTRKTAETAYQVHSSTSTLATHLHQRKIVLVPCLWFLKQHSRQAVKVHVLHPGSEWVTLQLLTVQLLSHV